MIPTEFYRFIIRKLFGIFSFIHKYFDNSSSYNTNGFIEIFPEAQTAKNLTPFKNIVTVLQILEIDFFDTFLKRETYFLRVIYVCTSVLTLIQFQCNNTSRKYVNDSLIGLITIEPPSNTSDIYGQ